MSQPSPAKSWLRRQRTVLLVTFFFLLNCGVWRKGFFVALPVLEFCRPCWSRTQRFSLCLLSAGIKGGTTTLSCLLCFYLVCMCARECVCVRVCVCDHAMNHGTYVQVRGHFGELALLHGEIEFKSQTWLFFNFNFKVP